MYIYTLYIYIYILLHKHTYVNTHAHKCMNCSRVKPPGSILPLRKFPFQTGMLGVDTSELRASLCGSLRISVFPESGISATPQPGLRKCRI